MTFFFFVILDIPCRWFITSMALVYIYYNTSYPCLRCHTKKYGWRYIFCDRWSSECHCCLRCHITKQNGNINHDFSKMTFSFLWFRYQPTFFEKPKSLKSEFEVVIFLFFGFKSRQHMKKWQHLKNFVGIFKTLL